MTEVVKELVKAGALLDVQNTVCPYPIVHDVQEHAYSPVVYVQCTVYTMLILKSSHSTYIHVYIVLVLIMPQSILYMYMTSVFHFYSLHREETQL